MDLQGSSSIRRVFQIVSPRALPYARPALRSLMTNALEPLHLHFITDSRLDKEVLSEEAARSSAGSRHKWLIFDKADLNDQAAEQFSRYPNLLRFRNGHPCWRKITDPLLLTRKGEEMVILDPDLFFPNRFSFEVTPQLGLLLMWQKPSCLIPTAIVDAAMRKRIVLAHHVDIGVAQWRSQLDLDWLNWLLQQLGISDHPNTKTRMHVEAIVWAAIAMHIGGGYLPPEHWRCWRRSQMVRLLLKLRVPGPQLLRSQPFSKIKCFHGGGEAKHWLRDAIEDRWSDSVNVLDQPGTIMPFVQLTHGAHKRNRAIKSWLGKLGYYHFFGTGALR